MFLIFPGKTMFFMSRQDFIKWVGIERRERREELCELIPNSKVDLEKGDSQL
jgi:hypothetical protein